MPSAQYIGALAFILVIILFLAALLAASDGVLRKIGAENERSRQFLSDWLAYKADCFAYVIERDSIAAGKLDAEMAACAAEFEQIGDSPMIDAMRKIEKTRRIYAEIHPAWAELRGDIAGLIDVRKAERVGLLEIEPFLSRARAFESAVGERIALMGRFEENQRRAVALLQQSLVATILALVGLGAWTSWGARRAQEDSRHMQELIGATYTAQEAERRRIALDLHDSIAQEISACLMIARRLGENGEGNRAALVASLKTTIDEVRRISWEMRPPELERLGFRGAVIGFLDDFTARCGLALDMTDSDWNASGLSDEAATHIYRIIQESFANIAKHAAATTLRIAISQGESRLSIAIEDDGRGFDAKVLDAPGSKLSHLGIGGMRERTRLIKGTLEILSVPGRGTTIRLEVPCAG